METRLNGILIDRFGDDEPAGYPTLCKGRFEVKGETYYALEEPTSLNVLESCRRSSRSASGDQGRRPPAQPDLRRPGDPHAARRARRLRRPGTSASTSNRPGRPNWPRSRKAARRRSAPTTGRGAEILNRTQGAENAEEKSPSLSPPPALFLAQGRSHGVLRRNGAEPGHRHHLRWRSRLLAPPAAAHRRLDRPGARPERCRQGSRRLGAGPARIGERPQGAAPPDRRGGLQARSQRPRRGQPGATARISSPARTSTSTTRRRWPPSPATASSAGCRRSKPTRTLVETLHKTRPAGVETEVFAFGKLPLAFSARCFTARHYGLNKDDCQFKCLDHPEG
jgi:hypothetical protein